MWYMHILAIMQQYSDSCSKNTVYVVSHKLNTQLCHDCVIVLGYGLISEIHDAQTHLTSNLVVIRTNLSNQSKTTIACRKCAASFCM